MTCKHVPRNSGHGSFNCIPEMKWRTDEGKMLLGVEEDAFETAVVDAVEFFFGGLVKRYVVVTVFSVVDRVLSAQAILKNLGGDFVPWQSSCMD
jgi:hypothetical protein